MGRFRERKLQKKRGGGQVTQPRVVCVAGPTACGKTKMGVALAKALGGEVVSVDSMQIYRGLTIGTAAPTEAER